MTTKTKAFETKDALDLYKKIIYTEGKAGRRMDKKQIEEMIDLAIKQLGYSYAPYSHFHVGAALLAKNGTYYTGCNIEMLLIHQQTVLRGLLFLKQSVKE